MFDIALTRFAISGILIGLFGLADALARRGAPRSTDAVPPPRWLHLAILLSISTFYLLIGPRGGAVAGGWGNLAGIAIALVAMAARFATRRGAGRIRHPAVASRMLFYVALPLAVGVPLGWLALSLPAVVASAICSVREDRILAARLGAPYLRRMASSRRWIPGVW